MRVSLPLLLPRESESFNARHDLGETVHRTLLSTNHVKILFTAVGNEDDIIESANSLNIHLSRLTY
jgi:hypothetical protein